MTSLIERLKVLSSAEDFLQFFGLPYDERVLHVHRLHILKRFFQYLQRAEGLADLDEVTMFRCYRDALAQAYEDFVHSTAAREKVFRVFEQADGARHVPLSSLKDSLAARRNHPT